MSGLFSGATSLAAIRWDMSQAARVASRVIHAVREQSFHRRAKSCRERCRSADTRATVAALQFFEGAQADRYEVVWVAFSQSRATQHELRARKMGFITHPSQFIVKGGR